MLKKGDKAPAFELESSNGGTVSSESLKGSKYILYFYPKDNTPGCTKQACGFKELYPDFIEKDAVIIGISKDNVASHKRFEEKYQLPFTLLADQSLDVIKAYDVWKEKNMYGKKVMGIVRSTYLINEDGVIVKAFEKVKPGENAQNMLAELVNM